MVLIDLFAPKETVLHSVDPRVKIIGAALLTVLCFFLSNLIFLAALLVALQLMIMTTGVRWKAIRSSLWLLLRFSLILVLLWPFFDQLGNPVISDLWAWKLTLPSLLRSLTVVLRVFVIASGWLILMITTRNGSMIRGLVKLGLPYDFGLSLSIALRYIPNFLATIDMIREAQISRGFEIDKGGPVRRVRNFIPVLIPTFAIAFRAIEGLSLALVSRGYGSSPRRTYYREIRMRISDGIAIAFIVVATPLLIILGLIGMVPL